MTKKYYLILFLACLGVVLGLAIPSQSVRAQTQTTFPVDQAGIAAYVKLDADPQEMIQVLTDALPHFSPKETPETTSNYVIGVVKIENKFWKNYPHLYIGLDGWMVAYYLKDKEASRIMQWKGYKSGELNTTTLKDAIDLMSNNTDVTYSTEVKYYNFAFPNANKMTLIAETLPEASSKGCSNSFSVTVPGTIYEASYSIYSVWWGQGSGREMYLKVDGEEAFSADFNTNEKYYGLYDPATHFEVNVPHLVELSTSYCNGEGAATVLIYQN